MLLILVEGGSDDLHKNIEGQQVMEFSNQI